jgi:hypothetical protein
VFGWSDQYIPAESNRDILELAPLLFRVIGYVQNSAYGSPGTHHTIDNVIVIFRNDDDLYKSNRLTCCFVFGQAISFADCRLTSSNKLSGYCSLLTFTIFLIVASAFSKCPCKKFHRIDSGMILVNDKEQQELTKIRPVDWEGGAVSCDGQRGSVTPL